MLQTCSLKVLGINALVKGFAIIKFVLMCLIDTIQFCTLSLTIRYIMSIVFYALELLLLLEKKIATKLLHKILNGFEIESKIQSLKVKFLNQSA